MAALSRGCKPRIRHFHIFHNAPYLPPPPSPQILHNLCFSFLLGITAVPREIGNNVYAKFWGANKVHYGKCRVAYVLEKQRALLRFFCLFQKKKNRAQYSRFSVFWFTDSITHKVEYNAENTDSWILWNWLVFFMLHTLNCFIQRQCARSLL